MLINLPIKTKTNNNNNISKLVSCCESVSISHYGEFKFFKMGRNARSMYSHSIYQQYLFFSRNGRWSVSKYFLRNQRISLSRKNMERSVLKYSFPRYMYFTAWIRLHKEGRSIVPSNLQRKMSQLMWQSMGILWLLWMQCS